MDDQPGNPTEEKPAGPAARIADEALTAVLGLQFLTRLAIPIDTRYSTERMARAMGYLPLAGLVIGAGIALVYWLAASVLPPLVAAFVALGAGVRLTGSLHEDGLADVADGLGGGATRERALEIMRDSRIGSYGVITLIIVVGLKAASIGALGPAAVATIIAAHGLSRLSVLAMMVRLPYARKEGAAAFAGTGPGPTRVAIAVLTGAATFFGLALLVSPLVALVAALAAAAVYLWLERMLKRRIGGYTGDALGGLQQLTETAILLAVLACL
ncbi:adenosylcobinamide-GDP ribazoletransferase [Rhodobium gokarnense]|uniref:Adenosylcobinamide-GDP ribazoletransferase n=1 Tax=Rhodobium gokarnense TaxID=364296 RepID=A0ABT3H6G1_9HYPH|nr:adenosylcobinamide-GDP ribazoletransferase [Rhodobium gokarnense]MCW2305966.1 adenosylcobinamide-GDP ribazoletransferase [Rhodobium gokarnense]